MNSDIVHFVLNQIKTCKCTCCFLQVFGFITTVVLGVETYFLLMSLRRDHAPSDNKVLNMLGVPPSNRTSPQSPDYDPESVPDTKYWRGTITCNSESFIVRFLGISTIQTDHCKCLLIALNSSIVVVYPCKVCNCTGFSFTSLSLNEYTYNLHRHFHRHFNKQIEHVENVDASFEWVEMYFS